MPRLFRLALSHRRWLVVLGATALLGAGAAILQMESLSRIIDGAFLRRADLMELREPLLWLAGAIGLRAATLWLSELASQEVAARVKEQLRNRLLRSLTRRGPLFTQCEKTGELATCVVEGVEKLDAWYAKFLPHAMAMAIVPATLALFVLWIDWPSGVVLMLTGPLILVFMALIGMMAQRKTQQQWAALSRMSGHFLEVLQGLPTLHLFGLSSVQGSNISRVSEHFRRATMRVLLIAFLSGLVLELAASISTALVAVEIGVRLIEGMMDFQTGLLVLLLAPEFYLPFRQFGASHHAGMEGAAAGKRIFELLDDESTSRVSAARHSRNQSDEKQPPIDANGRELDPFIRVNSRAFAVRKSSQKSKIPNYSRAKEDQNARLPVQCNGDAAKGLQRPRPRSRSGAVLLLPNGSLGADTAAVPIHIRFQDVDYQYPRAPAPAICGLTFELQPGRIHLLAGESGAGKSTVMKLLLRFIQPTGGALMVNGRSLLEIPPELWRSQVAFVSQYPHFFEGSVLDNLRAARPGAALEEVRTAARLAEAEEFVMALPQGYQTPISEAAARFSGGERQRLAIARAFLKDSPLLLFDEPTSHLDVVTTTKLQQAFLRLARHRTTLVIAHHGLVVTGADIVFVLSRGRLLRSTERSSFAHSINLQAQVEPTDLEVQTL
jgi:ATP-binding cassette subfamily C protein CydD